MLRITIELLPGGWEDGRRPIAVADVGRIRGGRLGTYSVTLNEEPFGLVGEGQLVGYPRYAATIWDLAARCIALSMTGKEELPIRPPPPRVPVHRSGTLAYVLLGEIPEPARSLFARNVQNSTRPVVDGETKPEYCAYLWDWEDFVDGRR